MEGDWSMSSALWYSDSGATSATATSTVFDTRYVKFIFNKRNVSALYIDWGDGPSRKPDESNYQWVQFPAPVQEAIVSHTYTSTGNYDIAVQTINQDGLASKYYCSGNIGADVYPFEKSKRIERMVTSDGVATSIMKLENRTVKSGIDNSIFELDGPRQVYAQIPPILNATELGYLPGKIKLGVTAVLVDSIRDASSNEVVVGGGSRRVKKIYVELSRTAIADGTYNQPLNILDNAVDISGNAAAIDGAAITQILKVEYRNPKITGANASSYTHNEVFNRLKVFLLTLSSDGKYYPLSYVTSGSPIKSVDDLYRYVTLDFSQSRAKAANVSNSKYRYDNGKVFFNPMFQWAITGTNYLNNNTRQTGETKRVDFTYMPRPDGLRGSSTYSSTTTGTLAFGSGSAYPWVSGATTPYIVDQFGLDDFGRFYDQYHMVRNSMQPTTSADATGTTVSSIIDNKPSVFRITPPTNWTGSTDVRQSATKIDGAGADENHTADYTSKAFNNGSSNEVSFTDMNDSSFKDISNSNRVANEYFLLLFPKKTNKAFFNMTNYAQKMMSNWSAANGITVAGLYYLKVTKDGTVNQNAEWQAIEFEDTTSISKTFPNTSNGDALSGSYVTKEVSFAKSGYIGFDTPDDWSAISLDNLCGGYFDSTDQTATGSLGIKVTGGTVSGNTTNGTYGKVLVVTGATISDQMESHFNTSAEVGAYKYIAFPSGTSNMPLWLGNGAGDGWDDDTLYFNYGANNSSNYNVEGLSGAKSWIIRRVNVYDVIDGPSKFYKGASATALPPVDSAGSGSAVTWKNHFVIAQTGSGVGAAIKTAWETTDMYALKIAISGSGDAAVVPKPEMWNVFDGTEANTAIIKQIDDSAYNLNSIPLTSDIGITRAGNYYTAISKKGKVFIARTGTPIQSMQFSSVGLGDSESSTAFSDSSASASLYGHLHKVRDLQSNDVRVYWDEKQKDATYVRFWGIIQNVSETHGTGGSRAILNYNFNMTVEEIALMDIDGEFMTDVFPIGGVVDDRNYT
tara:strand:- start:2288 stop:5350 length:3063 start_codon:yes stop_codon:yes gene_type:complete